MSYKLSTGLRDHILATGSLKTGLDGSVIKIYSGSIPATADAALSGNTLLCTISNDAAGTGISLDTAPASGVIGKNPAEVWRGLIAASGTATFYRFEAIADDGTLSTTALRAQGSVGVVDADLMFSSVAFVAGNYKNIDSYYVALPTQ